MRKRELIDALRSRDGLVSSLWIVGAIVVWVMSLAHGRNYLWHFKTLATATAVVTDTDEDVIEMDDGRRAVTVTVAAYEFTVGGNAFRGATHGPLGNFTEGQSIQIQFDADNPADNREKGRTRVPYEYALILFTVSVICFQVVKTRVESMREIIRSSRRMDSAT